MIQFINKALNDQQKAEVTTALKEFSLPEEKVAVKPLLDGIGKLCTMVSTMESDLQSEATAGARTELDKILKLLKDMRGVLTDVLNHHYAIDKAHEIHGDTLSAESFGLSHFLQWTETVDATQKHLKRIGLTQAQEAKVLSDLQKLYDAVSGVKNFGDNVPLTRKIPYYSDELKAAKDHLVPVLTALRGFYNVTGGQGLFGWLRTEHMK
ncbi:hypothetical protein HY490_02505 [Candidatus Woesearchaeota archaeon]|nr:hypothetical protein [Candidatus Woesearchaeota archaeon]